MKIYEFMVENSEKLEVRGDATVFEMENYHVNGAHQYDVVQVTTANPCETIRKIDCKGTVWKPADCFTECRSSYTGKDILSIDFWEEAK